MNQIRLFPPVLIFPRGKTVLLTVKKVRVKNDKMSSSFYYFFLNLKQSSLR